MMNNMFQKKLIMSFLLLTLVIPVLFVTLAISPNGSSLRSFSSYGELERFIKAKILNEYFRDYLRNLLDPHLMYKASPGDRVFSIAGEGVEFSTTNVQVSGVDEADTVKTDGEYIYMVSEGAVLIVKAYPPEEMRVVARIKIDGRPLGLFVNDDRLVVLEQNSILIKDYDRPPYCPWMTVLEVYDVSNIRNPVLRMRVSVEGDYLSSRMIGRHVYVVTSSPAFRILDEDWEVLVPKVVVDNRTLSIPPEKIFYSGTIELPQTYTTIVSVNVYADGLAEYRAVLTGYASCMYVSTNNIYIAMPKGSWMWDGEGSTEIHRVRINGLEIRCEASGEVPGRVLNQFSMDEYEGCFRIATTTGHVARFLSEATSANHVYVLDSETLKIVGKLENLAPGESIYSARFMGSRCYLVTFKKVDPLFTIDLSNPAEPRVLGKLKIPGYSDYLHPYDDNHLIGLGKETVEAEEGDFAWYQGLKISLFDVSNVTSPREVGKMIIGDRGTDSPALRDHHAFLFDRKRSLLVIPILEAKIFREKYPEGVPPYAYGEYVFQGAYVFKISPEEGVILRGRVTHLEDAEDLEKSGYYFSSKYQVERSLYIGDVLYTISRGKIKANSIATLSEISEVKLD
jgi:uncharacterized secreted protein with C-terminal beta-propeller domain